MYEDRSWSDPTREELAQALVSLVYSLDTLSRALAIWHEAAVAASMPSRMMHKRAPPTLLDALRNVQSAASSVRTYHPSIPSAVNSAAVIRLWDQVGSR